MDQIVDKMGLKGSKQVKIGSKGVTRGKKGSKEVKNGSNGV